MIKPNDFDISFQYICQECNASHWLFYREVKTKGFKVVCECNHTFEPVIIKDINIIYDQSETKEKTDSQNNYLSLSDKSINVCLNTLEQLGYTKTESIKMIHDSFAVLQLEDCNAIIKHAISNIGV